LTVFAPRDAMETNAMSGNQVEFFAQIRQGRLCIDSRDDAANAEELGRAAEKRFVIRVKAETFVTEELAEVEEITRAAAKIQNVERRRPIEPEVLHPLYIHANPVVRVLVSVNLSRVRPIGIMYAQPNQLRPING